MRIFCTAKDSHIFSTKNKSVFLIFVKELWTLIDSIYFLLLLNILRMNGQNLTKFCIYINIVKK